MQWAVRQRGQETTGATSSRTGGATSSARPNTGGIVYIDPATLRHTTASVVPAVGGQSQDNSAAMTTTVRIRGERKDGGG